MRSCRVRLFVTPSTVAYQAPPSMGFSRQEYWCGLPFPSPGDLPDPGIEPRYPALRADALTSEPPGKPQDGINTNIRRHQRDFPGSPAVKILHCHCRGYGFCTWSGNFLKKEEDTRKFVLSLCHGRTWQEGGHLQTRKTDIIRTQPYWHSDLGLLASRKVRK